MTGSTGDDSRCRLIRIAESRSRLVHYESLRKTHLLITRPRSMRTRDEPGIHERPRHTGVPLPSELSQDVSSPRQFECVYDGLHPLSICARGHKESVWSVDHNNVGHTDQRDQSTGLADHHAAG